MENNEEDQLVVLVVAASDTFKQLLQNQDVVE